VNAWFIAAPIIGAEAALAFIAIKHFEPQIIARLNRWVERNR